MFSVQDLLTANADTLVFYMRLLREVPDETIISWKRRVEQHIADTPEQELRRVASALQIVIRFAINEARKVGGKNA